MSMHVKPSPQPTTTTWSGGTGGKIGGVSEGPSSTGKLPIQPGSNSTATLSTSTDTFSSTTSSGTKVSLTGT